nr:toluene tolerance protein [Stutzerimonas xanthomarina]
MPTFNKLTEADLAVMVSKSCILEQDSHGPKVYQLRDGNILKLFRRKRLLSSALLRPHSVRFCRNAEKLQTLGIPTLEPMKLYRLDDSTWTAVLYRPLPGRTLSQIVREKPALWPELKPRVSAFFQKLHHLGIYFRSLHLGNIVLTPEQALGLIDIADLQIRRRPLSRHLIRRNKAHFENYLRKEQLQLDCEGLWPLN